MEAAGLPESALDFSFGLDDKNYSDRTLLLHIVNTQPPPARTLKRRRHDGVAITAATTAPSTRVKTIHITSLILAARSPFFRKLFSNGMRESEEKNVTIQIEASGALRFFCSWVLNIYRMEYCNFCPLNVHSPCLEETSFMDLLKYVYSNNLPTALNSLLNLLVIADKFEVTSCLRDCSRSLQKLPMTYELASLYLDILPQSLLMSPTFQQFIDDAKQFFVSHFKDFDKFEEEMLDLPLAGIQAVLSSDDLQVPSEFEVFDVVLAWIHNYYPNLEEGREILQTHLLHLIRFPFMTTTELTEYVQTCRYIDPELATKIVIRALCFKAGSPHEKRRLAAKDQGNATSRQFVERAYKCRPVKVVEPVSTHQQCIIYLHFSREKLTQLFPEGHVISEIFHLGEQGLVLFCRCSTAEDNLTYFWLALDVLGSTTCTINYDIGLRMKPREEFKSWAKGSHTFTEPERIKYLNGVLWTEFIRDDSTYFINDILHVMAEFRIKK